MRKIWIIIQREYLSRVRKKSFIITTLLAPLAFLLFMAATFFIGQYQSSVKTIAVIDDSGFFKELVFADAEDGSMYFKYPKADYKAIAEPLSAGKPSEYNAIIYIPKDFEIENPNKIQIQYLSDKRPGFATREFIDKTISTFIQKRQAELHHIDNAVIEEMNKDISINYELAAHGKEKSGFIQAAAGIGYFTGFAVYISLIIYGTMIMKGVTEEKNNRIMEVLASSVKPVQLMMGKIIGIGAVGLTQFLLWIVLIAGTNLVLLPILGLSMHGSNTMAQPAMNGSNIDPDDIQKAISSLSDIHFLPIAIAFVVYFLGGFLLYGSLFAAVGAAGGDETDSQSLSFPIMLPIIVSSLLMMNALAEPDGKLAFWASIIPFSSPIVMPALMAYGPPWWQVLLSILLLIGGFILCAFIAAKIYRTGILMYGKKVTFKELVKWIFVKG